MNQDQSLSANQQSEEVLAALRELSMDEVLVVAGGPEIINDRGVM